MSKEGHLLTGELVLAVWHVITSVSLWLLTHDHALCSKPQCQHRLVVYHARNLCCQRRPRTTIAGGLHVRPTQLDEPAPSGRCSTPTASAAARRRWYTTGNRGPSPSYKPPSSTRAHRRRAARGHGRRVLSWSLYTTRDGLLRVGQLERAVAHATACHWCDTTTRNVSVCQGRREAEGSGAEIWGVLCGAHA